MLPPSSKDCKYCGRLFVTFAQRSATIKFDLHNKIIEHYKFCKVKLREDRLNSLLNKENENYKNNK